jgi:hypothetical protein
MLQLAKFLNTKLIACELNYGHQFVVQGDLKSIFGG